MRVNVGDVVLIDYANFAGDVVQGVFVVTYHEAMDDRSSNNFTAIKISTNEYLYQIKLEKSYLPFLEHDSYMNCNQFFRFREQQVRGILGRLTLYYMNKMMVQLQNHFNRWETGLIKVIGVGNVFQ